MVCVHTGSSHVRTHTHTYTHTHTCTHTHIQTHTLTHVYIIYVINLLQFPKHDPALSNTHTRAHTHTHTHTHTHAHTHKHTHAHTQTHTHTHTFTYRHAHTYTHTRTHTCFVVLHFHPRWSTTRCWRSCVLTMTRTRAVASLSGNTKKQGMQAQSLVKIHCPVLQ